MADGDTHVDLLSQLWLVKGKPATVDAAGFAAVGTYVRLKGLLNIPQTGDTAEDVSEATLDEGRTEHTFGVVDGGSIELSIKGIEGDAGQNIITGERNLNDTYSFKFIDSDTGKVTYKFGRIGPVQRRERTPNSFQGYIVPIMFNSKEVFA